MKISDIEIFVHGKSPEPEFVTLTLEKEEYKDMTSALQNIIDRCDQGLSNPNVLEKSRRRLIRRKELLEGILRKLDEACLHA